MIAAHAPSGMQVIVWVAKLYSVVVVVIGIVAGAAQRTPLYLPEGLMRGGRARFVNPFSVVLVITSHQLVYSGSACGDGFLDVSQMRRRAAGKQRDAAIDH